MKDNLKQWFDKKYKGKKLFYNHLIDADKKLFNVEKTIENKNFYLCTNIELIVNIVNVANNSPFFYVYSLGKIEIDKNNSGNLLYKYRVNVREEADFLKIKKDSLKFFNDGKPLKGNIILYIVEE